MPGNHDTWVCGSPPCGDVHDQFGHGFMQYYAMDPVASTLAPQDDTHFLSFSVDPDASTEKDKWHTFLNNHTNFIWYNKIGPS